MGFNTPFKSRFVPDERDDGTWWVVKYTVNIVGVLVLAGFVWGALLFFGAVGH